MLTEEGKLKLEKIIVTGNVIGLITNQEILIEKDLKLFHWEEKYNILFTTVIFTDFDFIDFTVIGYYLKKDSTIFYSENFEESFLVQNKKDKIEIDLKLYLENYLNE